MTVEENCFISTGSKDVMYTLWEEIIVRKKLNNKVTERWGCGYIQNLSMTETEAVQKAKNYASEHKLNFTGIQKSPTRKRAEHFEAFGISFKPKLKNGKAYYYGEATQEFWESWKNNKEQMKTEGFSVSKYRVPPRYRDDPPVSVWYIFYRPKEA